jgi:hypothetical protein
MAKAEFGRHYVNDKQLEEVQRSMARAKARRGPVPWGGTSKKKR